MNVRDLLMHLSIARMAGDDNTVHEIEAVFDKITNTIDLPDLSEDALSAIENVTIGSKLKRYLNWVHRVVVPWSFESFIEKNQRFVEENIHGALFSLATGQTLTSASPINTTKGTGKVLIVVNAGSDTSGTVTITGNTVDRDTGAIAAGTDSFTIDGLTVDNSTTDAEGTLVHDLERACISSKWFTGAISISTTDINLSDVDIWHISFEQVNDQPNLTLETLDINAHESNSNAWLYAYLYLLQITAPNLCSIRSVASVSVPSGSGIGDQFWRLRRGSLNTPFDGTTDGIWLDLVMGPANFTYWEDITVKVWGTTTLE